MVVQYDAESLTPDFIKEAVPLLKEYYEKTQASYGIPPYDFDWDTYEYLDKHGSLVTVTARLEGRLVGFIFYLVSHHLHHKTTRFGQCDGMAVDMNVRGHGIGRGMIEFATDLLRERGCESVIHNYRRIYNTVPLFEKLGFEAIETVYMKRL